MGRADRARPLSWIQVGSVAGPEINLPSYLLRAASLSILGSGQGSVSTAGVVAELPSLAELITAGALAANPVAVPLRDVERAWPAAIEPGQRIVLTL